jgi:hypothetical protein
MRLSENDPVLLALSGGDEAASISLLVHLCREFPAFRSWLCDEFGRDAALRQRFASLVDGGSDTVPRHFIDMSDDGRAWREEQRQLREALPTRPFGGLSLGEVETLIRSYQAGTIDLGTFLLSRAWRSARNRTPAGRRLPLSGPACDF